MKYRVIRAFGAYSVGALIEPTGVYRGELLRTGFIAPQTDPKPVERAIVQTETATTPEASRRRPRTPRIEAVR